MSECKVESLRFSLGGGYLHIGSNFRRSSSPKRVILFFESNIGDPLSRYYIQVLSNFLNGIDDA